MNVNTASTRIRLIETSTQGLPFLLFVLGMLVLIVSQQSLNTSTFQVFLDYNDDGIILEEIHGKHYSENAVDINGKNCDDDNLGKNDCEKDVVESLEIISQFHENDKNSIFTSQQETVNQDTNITINVSNENTNTITKNSTTPKPLLILHVGVMKTGTTYIQLELLRKKRWNRIYKKLLLDGYEVITQEYAPQTFEKVIKDCLQVNEKDSKKKRNHQLWQDLIDLYKDAHTWNQKENIIQSLETFSMIPKPFNDYTKHLMTSLKDEYEVKIVVFYRRLHEWIVSMYAQYRKPFMYRTRSIDGWRQDYGSINEVKLLPDWLESMLQNNQFHYTTPTQVEYQNLFGEENVQVLDYHANHGLEVEFICNGIPNSNEACREAKKIAQEHKDDPEKVNMRNTREMYLLDHDLLVSEAYRNKLIEIGRHNATIVLEEKMNAMNIAMQDLPRKCLSTTRQLWLDELSHSTETSFASQPFSDSEFEDYIAKYQSKLCSVDAAKALQNDTWIDLFSTCEFQIKGCARE